MPKGIKGFQKGHSGNLNGRPMILAPELQDELAKNKNAVKKLILTYFNLTESAIAERQRNPEIPFVEKILGQCFEKTSNDGDVVKFRMLLEIVFGKIPEEPKEFELTAEEKKLVVTFRQRLAELATPGNDQ